MSIERQPERIWVGMSRVNELIEIPAYSRGEHNLDKLETTLRDLRHDPAINPTMELAVDASTSGDELLQLVRVGCPAFGEGLAVVEPGQLSARATP